MDSDCAFCDRTKFEERIIGEDKNFWIIATLGQITDGGYTLLVPKKHIPCIGAMGFKEIEHFEDLAKRIRLALSVEYGIWPVNFFEHGIVGQTIKHAHIHFVPENWQITERILKDFPEKFINLHSWLELQFLYTVKPEPYILWLDSREEIIKVYWNPPAPLQYLRIVIAEALGRPERADWRNMDPELDKKLWTETVIRLKPYFR